LAGCLLKPLLHSGGTNLFCWFCFPGKTGFPILQVFPKFRFGLFSVFKQSTGFIYSAKKLEAGKLEPFIRFGVAVFRHANRTETGLFTFSDSTMTCSFLMVALAG
jgi:hypothetical protein